MDKVNILVPLKMCMAKNKAVAGFDPANQPDLLYMKSVLVSTGANLNDDVFLPDEMWNARSSPIFKPVNWEHNSGTEISAEDLQSHPNKVVVDNQTIGVMYNSYVTDENGVIISDERASANDFEIPENFNIEDEAVIYKELYPNTAARIERGAENNTLFVSMEAWFKDYSYLVGNKVVARNEETAFLDKNLKAFGGNGAFGNTTVKRALRGITFGGKGIVERPANEPSVIKKVTHFEPTHASVLKNSAIANNIIGNIGNSIIKTEESDKMNDNKVENIQVAAIPLDQYTKVTDEATNLRAEVKATAGELSGAKAKTEELNAELENINSAFAKGIKALEQVIPGISNKLESADVAEFFNVLTAAVETKNSEVVQANEKLAESNKKLADAEASARASARLSKIQAELNLNVVDGDDDATSKAKLAQAHKIAEETKELDDEAFASKLEDLKNLLTIAAFVPFGKDKDKKDDKDKKEKKDAKDAKANKGEGFTDASILESIVANDTVPAGTEDNDAPALNLTQSFAGLAKTILKANRRQKPVSGENN